MKTYTQRWIENFQKALTHIQIEFDAFFPEGEIEDYYSLKIDEATGMVTLIFPGNNALPKEIEDALTAAFMESKPID